MLGSVLFDIMRSIMSGKDREVEAKVRPLRTDASYSAAVFDATDMERARSIILTAAPDITTDQRWEIETRNTLAELSRLFSLDARSIVLDYGCGAGRMAKALIDAHPCSVVGVDISPAMRELARSYVNSERFGAWDLETLEQNVAHGFRATHAYCCWVLQHCESPEQDVARISSALDDHAELFVLNSNYRWVPTLVGWQSDNTSVERLLASAFDISRKTSVEHIVASPTIANQSYSLLVRKRSVVDSR